MIKGDERPTMREVAMDSQNGDGHKPMDFSKTRATRALPSPQFALLGSLGLNLKAAGESKRWPPWPGWLPFAHRPPKPHHDSPVQEIFEIRFLYETFLHTYKIRIGGYESLSHPEIASNQIVWFIHDLVILSVDHAIAKGGGYDKFRDHRVLGKASFSLYQYVRIIQVRKSYLCFAFIRYNHCCFSIFLRRLKVPRDYRVAMCICMQASRVLLIQSPSLHSIFGVDLMYLGFYLHAHGINNDPYTFF